MAKLPIDPNAAPPPRQGYGGFPVYGNRSYPGTDEFHPELQGGKADRKYREMLANHALTASSFRILTQVSRGAHWSILPAADTPEAIAAADELRAAWDAMTTPWPDVLAEMLTAVPLGWSWHEVVYKNTPDGIAWDGLYFCRQDSRLDWRWDDGGRYVTALDQLTRAGQSAIIPAARAVHFVPDTTNQGPEGGPWLRTIYIDYRNQQQIMTSLGIGVQKDATGMLVTHIPTETWNLATEGDATATATVEAIKKGTANLQRGEREGIVLPSATNSDGTPSGWSVELLKAGGQRQFDHVEIVRMYEQRIATGLLTQFLLLGQEKSASFALSSDQTALLAFVLTGILDSLCATVKRQLFAPFIALRGLDPALCPTLAHGPIDEPSLKDLAELLKAGVGSGTLTPDPALEDHIRRLGGLPPRSSEGESL